MRHLGMSVAALALTVMPALASEESTDFREKLPHVGSNYVYTAMWVDVLVRDVTPDCGLKINKGLMTLWVSQSSQADLVGTVIQRYRDGAERNPMITDWKSMHEQNADAACSMATGLWGEDGVMTPGILEKR